MARASLVVCRATVSMTAPPAALISRTAWISRMAASPRFTIAMREITFRNLRNRALLDLAVRGYSRAPGVRGRASPPSSGSSTATGIVRPAFRSCFATSGASTRMVLRHMRRGRSQQLPPTVPTGKGLMPASNGRTLCRAERRPRLQDVIRSGRASNQNV